MFIQKIQIRNYRAFSSQVEFETSLNVPDKVNDGSGLSAFVGENGCGKTALLEAIALPLVQYKAEGFELDDLNDPSSNIEIKVLSKTSFPVRRTMPKAKPFQAKGLLFKANVRTRESQIYLSSIVVSDQLFIKADGVTTPEDESPDLRVNVNNPFSGRRFDENDILVLDFNRTYQTRSGTYNPTRFDRLMEDFDLQHIKKNNPMSNINQQLSSTIDEANNEFLNKAVEKFKEISGEALSLNLINNWRPFSKGFLAVVKSNHQQLPLSTLGSGYEMIFSILVSFYLAQQSGKQLICLIDEPELHLHPSLQEKFVQLVLEFSRMIQIVVATHSPLLVKQLSTNNKVLVQILNKDSDGIKAVSVSSGVLPYTSANEINYLAFNLATVEYHDELYGHIKDLQQKYTEEDMVAYFASKGIANNKRWTAERNGQSKGEKVVPLQVFIRNKSHHPENKTMAGNIYTYQELKQSIDEMVKIIRANYGTAS